MGSVTVDNWLSRLGEATARDYHYTLNRWMQWMAENGGKFKDYTPDDLVEYQKSCTNSDFYEILDYAQRWILTHTEHSFKTKHAYLAGIQSFFLHNRAPLPKDKGFKIRGDKPKTVSKLTEDQVKEIVLIQKPMYQAIFMTMAMTSMGCKEFVEWSNTGYQELRKQLVAGEAVIKIDMPGRKSARNETPYYTLLGGDGLRALKHYIGDDLPAHREAIFITPMKMPLKIAALKHQWNRSLRRLGIINSQRGRGTGVRYGFGIHNLRDLWRTNWSRARCAEDVGEFLMGHIIDQYGYNQIYRDVEYVKDEYRKVLKFLNYLSHSLDLTDSTTDELMNRIADLEVQLENSIQATPDEKSFQEGFMGMMESPVVREKFMIFLKDLAEEE